MLACLFVVAIWGDTSQPARAPIATYVLLGLYVAWSLWLAVVVWNDWWQDARLSAAAHVVDVAVFMAMLYSTEGYTSPYFTFFIFILLAAAIRWGWKETAITALAVVAVYMSVGLMLGPSPQFEVERFIIRTGHLVIISAILVWFGANQWVAWPRMGQSADGQGPVRGDAFVATLQAGMAATGARRGTLLWRETGDEEIGRVHISPAGADRSVAAARTELPSVSGCLLFDLGRDRVLMREDASRWRFLQASQVLPAALRKDLDGGQGLVVPIDTATASGVAVFQNVRALSTDHLDFAPRVAREMGARLQEAALFAAVEDRSMAKARVAVARDLHDSVVQFLAGLGFRLEALRRSPAAEGELADGLADLKDTVMTEQRQLRAFIRGLRTGQPISLKDLSRDCASLCALLSRQWSIDCACACKSEVGWISLRTQLDFQHLVREAVANAVRHGGATEVRVAISREAEQLCLSVQDNGKGFAPLTEGGQDFSAPASLTSRVRELDGGLEVHSAPGKTSVLIRLPMDEAA